MASDAELDGLRDRQFFMQRKLARLKGEKRKMQRTSERRNAAMRGAIKAIDAGHPEHARTMLAEALTNAEWLEAGDE